ncbi:hypothetical protein [Psychrobacillus lasiicapitis]|uniref:Uncharacterized protein n=1 Tax=Psychrobacillus lasiicapitis TaxID=1636719 RepID=A0A544T5D2_9BACI|nr:hypothetical protein [Psychrobacillus lasiicapitis]TQR12662.1 hypothetical protein FG382_13660 [Psychrobacillus lasiicapitis]GGA39924.1 oxalate:formate antiporter [Psychrobacillus lasiicapitis]
MAKKEKEIEEYITHLYVHVNDIEHFVLFSGITVHQFIRQFSDLPALLLLKHEYEEASFNIHTQLEFVVHGQYNRFLKEFAERPTALCLLDFTDERKLNMLSPQEQAELLYIAHKKETLRLPFYHHLQNRFVYLTDESEQITKIYFRDIEDFHQLVASVFNQQISEKVKTTAFWRKKNNIVLPELTTKKIEAYADYYEDGVLMSLCKIGKANYGIEIRSLPDNIFPDEVLGDLKHHLKKPADFLIQL